MMRAIVCVWLPNWAIQRRTCPALTPEGWGIPGADEEGANSERARCAKIARDLPSRPAPPLVLISEGPRGSQVVACSTELAESGVMPGQPMAEAEALVDPKGRRRSARARFERDNPEEDKAVLRRLSLLGEQFTPLFGIETSERPECVLLDVTGCAHLYQESRPRTGCVVRRVPQHACDTKHLDLDTPEARLLADIVETFQQHGLTVLAALAPTIGAAWAAAHCFAAVDAATLVTPQELVPTLSAAPVEGLRLPSSIIPTLRELGLTTIGHLQALPRADLPSRFGPLLVQRLSQMWGEVAESFPPERPVHPPVAKWEGDDPLVDRQSLEALCRTLLDDLLTQLQPRRQGFRQLRCVLRDSAGKAHEFSVRFLVPTDAFPHILEMLKLQWERASRGQSDQPFPEEVAGVRLEAALVDALAPRQRDLFGGDLDSEKSQRDVNALLDRLNSRLGDEAIVQAQLLPEAQPELSVGFTPVESSTLSVSGVSAARDKGTRRKSPASRSARSSSNALRQGHRGELNRTAPGTAVFLATWGEGSSFVTRPLWLFADPEPLERTRAESDGTPASFAWHGEHHVVRSWGPERIRTGWWRAAPAHRDYYRVEVATGHHLWLFHRLDHRDWFVHGVFE